MSSGGKLTLFPSLSAAEEFSVLTHEIANELLHRGDGRKKTTKTSRTAAEVVAFVVSTALGLDPGTPSSDSFHSIQATKTRWPNRFALSPQCARTERGRRSGLS